MNEYSLAKVQLLYFMEYKQFCKMSINGIFI